MPGLLSFTLALQNAGFQKAIQQSTASEDKFSESVAAATKRLKEQYGVMASAPKPPSMPEPAPPSERSLGHLRHLRHELQLTGEIAQEAGVEIGGLARMAGLGFSPLLVAVSAVVLVIQKLREQFAKLHEQELAIISSGQQLRNSIQEGVADAAHQATAANIAFSLSLNHTTDSMDMASLAMQRRIELFRDMTSAQRQVFAAQEQAAQAQIRADESMHRISGPEAERRRQAAENERIRQDNAAEIAALEEEISEKKGRLEDAPAALAQATRDHTEAVRRQQKGNETITANKAGLKLNEQIRDEQLKAAGEAGAHLLDVLQGHAIGNIHDLWDDPALMASEAGRNAKNAQDMVITQKNKIAAAEQEQQFADAAVEKAKAKADIEKHNLDTLGSEITQLEKAKSITQGEQEEQRKAKKLQDAANQERANAEQFNQVRSLYGATAFEKMGFSFGRVGAPTPPLMSEHAARTAAAAERTAMGIDRIVQILNQRPGDRDATRAWNALFQNAMP